MFPGEKMRERLKQLSTEWVITLFLAGAAWGFSTWQLASISRSMGSLEVRVSNIEKYMIKESKGAFIPADPASGKEDQP